METSRCLSASFYWTAAAAFHLMFYRGSPNKKSHLFELIGKATLSVSRVPRVSDGYDPTMGIMHDGRDGSSKFIFDLMEPERPRIDRAVLDFVKGQVFDPADFVIRSDGVCRLNPEMARMVVHLEIVSKLVWTLSRDGAYTLWLISKAQKIGRER
jgi:hypothetical protein